MNQTELRRRRQQIAKAVFDGATVSEAAQQFEVGIANVYYSCREFGVTIPRNHVRNTVGAFTILKELFTEKTMTQIAAEYNITHQRVSEIYKHAEEAKIPGLPLRGRFSNGKQ